MGETTRETEATFFADEGIWPLCTEAQGDGVPCPDATRHCADCAPPAEATYEALMPDPLAPDAPLRVSGA